MLNKHDNSKVSQILEKSKFWENRLKTQTYQSDIKSILIQNQGRTTSNISLPKLANTFEQYTTKELALLERKNA